MPVFADQNGILQEGPGGAALTNIRIREFMLNLLQLVEQDDSESAEPFIEHR